ncbi:unnamed protein product [Amoebophrya sp. A25]|nr:unnamed protein product [Amoebophrya sp. A25]|eukprot:GSA25T00003434001.1
MWYMRMQIGRWPMRGPSVSTCLRCSILSTSQSAGRQVIKPRHLRRNNRQCRTKEEVTSSEPCFPIKQSRLRGIAHLSVNSRLDRKW